MDELRYTVPGMSCAHCSAAISAEVGRVAGVSDVAVDLDAKIVSVRGEAVDDGSVRRAIIEAGYEAVA